MRIPNDRVNKGIVLKHKQGLSFGELSKDYNRSKSTIHYIWAKYKNKYLLPKEKAVRV